MEEPDLTNRRTRKTSPKPAPDHGVDSAEVIPATPKKEAPAPSPKEKPEESKADTADSVNQMEVNLDEIVVHLNARVSLRYRQLLSHLNKTTGKTIRSLIEEALHNTYL